ncbi:MAG: c-type cytochrome [Tepidisphaera sp.]|nr:c-type cytochrome [Tepidisphaera sp.]
MNLNQLTRMLLVAGLSAGLAGVMTGCRGDRSDEPPHQFFPDMDDSPKWKPQSQTEFFANERTMRKPVVGTVAFGTVSFVPAPGEEWATHWKDKREDLLKDDLGFYQGISGYDKDGKPVFVSKIPASVIVDAALLKRGEERFNIYCTACHGYLGDAKGTVSPLYNPSPANFYDPTFYDPKNVRSLDGWIFHTIRWGKPGGGSDGKMNMPAYGHAVNERDAWAIVAYVRALEASREGTIEDVPEGMRDQLMKKRAAAGTTPAGQTAAATAPMGGAK